MSNTNQQNKLIKINGEYVKLYVTNNPTLPKLLKNTGSFVVLNTYNPEISLNENYLYLGNELIAGGWGLYTKSDRDKTQQFLKDYNHLYYVLTGIDNLNNQSFWDGQLNDVLGAHAQNFISNINLKGFAYSIPELLNDCLNDLITQSKDNRYVQQGSDISDSDQNLKISQHWYLSWIANSTNSGTNKNQTIPLKYLPYLFSTAKYNEPVVTGYNIEVEFGYFDRVSRKFTNFALAPKVDGKYLVPKGAFITKISVNVDIKLNDASSVYKYSYDLCYTKYNRNNANGNVEIENNVKHLFNIGISQNDHSSIFSNTSDWNAENNVFVENYKYTERSFDSKTSTSATVNWLYSYNSSEDNYLLINKDCTILKNAKLYYTGTNENKFKQYPSIVRSRLKNNYSSLPKADKFVSVENALDNGYINLDIDIEVKCVDVCRSYSYIVDPIKFDNDFTFAALFDYYDSNNDHASSSNNNKNAIGIFDNKINIPIEENVESNKALITFIAVPLNKIIKKMYINKTIKVNTSLSNTTVHNNVTGLLKHLLNCKIFGSCTPTTSSSSYIYANPIDNTNVFAQPFTLYCIITYTDKNQTIESFDLELDENIYFNYNNNYSFTHSIFGNYAVKYSRLGVKTHDVMTETIFEYNNKYLNWKNMNSSGCKLVDAIDDDYDGSHIFNLNVNNLEKDINPYLYTMSYSYIETSMEREVVKTYLERINGY